MDRVLAASPAMSKRCCTAAGKVCSFRRRRRSFMTSIPAGHGDSCHRVTPLITVTIQAVIRGQRRHHVACRGWSR